MSKAIVAFLRLILILAVPAIVSVWTYSFVNETFRRPLEPGMSQTQLLVIEPGMNFRQISKKLEDEGLVRHWWVLEILARVVKKTDTRINAGEYELSPSMRPIEILSKLVSGDVFKRKVTLPEGVSVWSVGKILSSAQILPAEDFEKALTDPGLLAAAGIRATSFEGYLFPETYLFSKPTTPRKVIWRMLAEGEKHWPQVYNDRAYELGLSRHEVLTLASIIEKETSIREEMPRISSVFHNRLKKGMRLQADPTVIYGVKDFDGNLTKEHLLTPTPYNTYTIFGLPPGPICNPGAEAIKAALYPAETSFLFFVADGTGGHVFTTTLKEHNNAVRQFQKARKRAAAANDSE